MTSEVCTVTPQETLRDARKVMREKRISGLPVVEGKKLVGVISVDDILSALDESAIDLPIEKRMTRDVKTLEPNFTLTKALQYFNKYHYGRFPVVDKDQTLLGIMTQSNITRRLLLELNSVADEAATREAMRMAQTYAFGYSTGQILLERNLRAGDYANAGIISSQLKIKLNELGIKPEIVRRAAIAAYEAETNIIIHSVGGKMKVWTKQGKLILEAHDSGPGIVDIEMAMKPGFSTASAQVRALGFGAGMGLPNIKQCADDFHIESQLGQGTLLTVEIQLRTADKLVSTV
jgi:CBS-domain-containing membrane protein/anti-sigma regulatory factor (Ser/Thr protein kinase)